MSSVFIFINGYPFAKQTITPTNKEVAELLEEIRDKTEKYNIERYSFNEEGINLAITGNQEDYHSVKNNVEHIVKNTIKSTAFEEYPILIEKGKLEQKKGWT